MLLMLLKKIFNFKFEMHGIELILKLIYSYLLTSYQQYNCNKIFLLRRDHLPKQNNFVSSFSAVKTNPFRHANVYRRRLFLF